MPNHPIDKILADMRDTGLQWLTDAADTIEQALAGQTYEYIVQVQDKPGGKWCDVLNGFYAETTTPTHVEWITDESYARTYADTYANDWNPHATRIVRRPVREIEVVE